MTATLRRDTPGYRVLVELAGQARPMTVKELFEATEISPEKLHSLISGDLYLYVRYVVGYGYSRGGDSYYEITWEGQEALRRADAVKPPSPAPVERVPWLARPVTMRRWVWLLAVASFCVNLGALLICIAWVTR